MRQKEPEFYALEYVTVPQRWNPIPSHDSRTSPTR